jgi:uncharacterized protein (DUF885 family)
MMLLAAGPASAATEDEKLAAFFRDYLDAAFAAEPLRATRLGDHRFDGKLDDLSAAAQAANLKREKQALADLKAKIDVAQLTPAGKLDFEIFQHELTKGIWYVETFDPYRDDPLLYSGYLAESVYLLLTQSTLPKADNLRNATARMARIPTAVEQARANLGKPPRVKVETALVQAKGAVGFYTDEIYSIAGQKKGEGEFAANAEKCAAAIADYAKFLETEVLPRSRAEWRIGKEAYEKKFAFDVDAGVTPDQAFADAEKEFARIEHELAFVSRQLWSTLFPGEVLPPDDADGRRELIRRVLAEIGKDHSTPDSLLKDTQATVGAIKEFIAKADILKLPAPDRCEIRTMPGFARGNSLAYLNPAPPLDTRATSEYAVSPPPEGWDDRKVQSLLAEYNRAMLQILTIHEAYPGHYVQLEYGNRNPSLIRRVFASGTFAEGWAVYTEQVMLDQGYGNGDLKLRMQQLKFYLRAVGNAILDHNMHAGTWTDEQALDFLTTRAFQTEGEARGKIVRAKQTSCQLSTYFVGRNAFYRLRQKVQREQGKDFQLGRFHEAVLSHGTLPVKYLPELVK